ncbi:UNVERIFIED_CONTAM: hypothetical protein Cloal_0261 [Acetivibrio alkalicellulosi]
MDFRGYTITQNSIILRISINSTAKTPSPETEGTKTTIETPTPEPYSDNTEVNQFENIGYYLGEWLNRNLTEVIEDEEGSLIEDTNDDKTVYMGFIRLDEYSRITGCMDIVRDKNGVQSNIIEDGKYIIRYEGMDDDGIRITVSRVEDTEVRARYIFDRTTLQYKVE